MAEKASFSTKELSEINAAIANMYAAASAPSGLRSLAKEVLDIIHGTVYFDKANLVVININGDGSNEVESACSLGWSKEDINVYVRKFYIIDDEISMLTGDGPFVPRSNYAPADDKTANTPYYKDFAGASAIQISIDANIVLNGVDNKRMGMALFRDPDKDEFSKKDIEIINTFQPHLTNIFSDFFKKPASNTVPIASVLDLFDTLGICMFDSDLAPTSFNCTYARFANENVMEDPLTETIRQYCASLSDSSDNSAMAEYVPPAKTRMVPKSFP